MLRILSLTVVSFVILCTTCTLDAATQFRNCNLYFWNEVPPEIENGDRFCVQSGRLKFCRNTTCPNLSCDDPQSPSISSHCPFCPGQCVHGGNVYFVGERFKCVDGVNMCTCYPDNMLRCSKLATNEQNLCS
ncbi:uncharacterized protein LOC132548338 [Ylistrum balloti]|uniref:uncharacterized protein LOC132548338 n=1 Tax=Ylistrum balloti TaxID=509963 RepID=UPI002905AED0|nr:uncharacterized protein LOC132548338 [Ylistrum balloti]